MAVGARLWVVVFLMSLVPATALAQVRSAVVASGFTQPIGFVVDPADPSTFYVIEQRGTIRVVRGGTVLPQFFLDLRSSIASGGERGLLGLAFPPDAVVSRRFYVNFTNLNGDTVVARFTRDTQGAPILSSRFDLVWSDGQRVIRQPFANHNGGHLAFGPDGYLYIGMGDGGSGGDPQHNAQNPNTLLGKMLRIDVNVPDADARGYRVPADNPFVDRLPVAALPEIWSFGLRNPWRFSFDDWTRGGTGALVVGDVGQSAREEVNWEPRGAGGRNYGWRLREGRLPYDARLPAAYQPLVEPMYDYPRSDGQSITGGFVYRGSALDPMFNGRYFFADFVAGRVYTLGVNLDAQQEATATGRTELTSLLGGSSEIGLISSFGVDADGELYVVSYTLGRVLKIVPVVPAALNVASPSVVPGGTIQVTVQNGSGFARDWVGLYPSSASDAMFVDWQYLNGSQTAPATGVSNPTLTFAAPATTGTYNLRLFTNGYTRLATSNLVTVSPPPSLRINDVSVVEGNSGVVAATFTVTVTPVNPTQTVTVSYATANGTALAGSDYTATSGTLTFNPGESSRPLNILVNGDITGEPSETFSVMLSNAINAVIGDAQGVGTITTDEAPPPPSLTVSPATVIRGSTPNLPIAIANGPATPRDWIGIYPPGAPDGAFVDWYYSNGLKVLPTNGISTTTIVVSPPPVDGVYEARLFTNGYNKLATSNSFTVSQPPPASPATLTLGATTIAPGGNLQITVANGAGGSRDWIGIYPSGAADVSFVDWYYLNGQKAPPTAGVAATTLMVAAPATPGTYGVRLFTNGYTKLATSADFSVASAPGAGPALTVMTPTVTRGGVIQVSVSNGPAGARDWIGVHEPAAIDGVFAEWIFLNSSKAAPTTGIANGTVMVPAPTTAGVYQLRFFTNGYTRLATSTSITVLP